MRWLWRLPLLLSILFASTLCLPPFFFAQMNTIGGIEKLAGIELSMLGKLVLVCLLAPFTLAWLAALWYLSGPLQGPETFFRTFARVTAIVGALMNLPTFVSWMAWQKTLGGAFLWGYLMMATLESSRGLVRR
ncbi:MAG TPA: hypothetical protein VM598_08095 [Bdellovibrionota bacterium]|nr:hypothetical protein [Bdellovibrionota bacterium]